MIEKAAIIFILFMTLVTHPFCSFASDKKSCSGAGAKEFRLDELKLCINEESEDGNYLLRFSNNGEVIFTGECAFKTKNPKIVRNAPLPNCKSLLAYCFSGGAHCCTTLFIATECGHKTSLAMADLAHGDEKVDFIEADGTNPKGAESP